MSMQGLTKKELAEVAGYTYRQLHNIDKELPEGRKLFVPSEDGKYDLPSFVQRWVDFRILRETEGFDDIDVVRARHEAVKIQKTELEVARMRGQFIDVADVRRLWGDIANTVMQNFLHLPSKVAPTLTMMESAEVIASLIDSEVRKILEDIAQTPLPAYAEDAGDGGDGGEDDGEEG